MALDAVDMFVELQATDPVPGEVDATLDPRGQRIDP
jgi:hypothetical protein